jgi:predicted AAA+ superfamily ATPase
LRGKKERKSIVFERKAYKKLLAWKAGNGESALLIEGARRTGKSTLAETFAAQEYESSLIINFETVEREGKDIFEQYRNDVEEFLAIRPLVWVGRFLGENPPHQLSLC